MTEVFQAYRSKLVGLPVSHVWRGHGTALFLELGKLTPRTKRDGSAGNPQGQYSIMIEWSWRIEDATSILCGSDNDDDEWSASFSRLLGSNLEDISLFGRLPELQISLSGEIYVASFNTLDGEPGWTIFDNAAERWIRVEKAAIMEESETEIPSSESKGAPL